MSIQHYTPDDWLKTEINDEEFFLTNCTQLPVYISEYFSSADSAKKQVVDVMSST